MENATTPVTTPAKPPKPWAGFPLYWHTRGYWMCKRGGQEHRYEADALRSYDRWKADVDAENQRRVTPSQMRKRYLLKDAVNVYLTRQKRRCDEGDLSVVQFAKCQHELLTHLPRAIAGGTPLSAFRAAAPDDDRPAQLFHRIRKKAIARGLQAAHRHIILVRAMLDFAADKRLMLSPDYGDDFDPPSKPRMDRNRNDADLLHGERAWSLDELRILLDAAKDKQPHLYAQCLLALFAGFGSDDCSAVPERAFNRSLGIVKFPRVKNGRPRVAALPKAAWDAIDASLAKRAPAKDEAARRLLFRTRWGEKCNVAPIATDEDGIVTVGRNDNIGQNFRRLLRRLKLQRYRAGFKTLRAMCRTLLVGGGGDSDLIAVIMGRTFQHPVDEYYLRGDLREKLFALMEHVERQLFPKP